jgi:hypothetical protein
MSKKQTPEESSSIGATEDIIKTKKATKSLKASLRQNSRLLLKHAYFAFLLLILVGLGVYLILINQVLSLSNEEYSREQKIKVLRTYKLNRSKSVEDKVLQSRRAGAGPIKPNYQPNRDNPFIEN